ncbi:amino acid transporter [Corynebacterium lizhenjunii]|uniref:Amino acid transporter n=1 Tax=Corynebacterium lizhenjunii TaxID=2709394 RepID=A0A7T0KHY2_9CORY|nr:LysE/ArgO family amino acid transporter [Corynebacterium lizhenjunii]QPK80043.1 amino acid transporter [Corynebacterium lizhenjunii]
MSIVLAGFALGLSLIVAIGPQNAFVIKQGIQRNHIGAIVAVCAISDVFLILGGTAGVGVLVDRFPTALMVLKYCGAAYLLYFAFVCFRDAFRADGQALNTADAPELNPDPLLSVGPDASIDGEDPTDGRSFTEDGSSVATLTRQRLHTRTWVKPVLGALALTWLNPGTYVDVLVMLGGIANQYGPSGRWAFAAGAILASFCWFPALGFGAARFSHVLERPKVWRGINVAIGCVMLALTVKLLLH